MFNKKIKEKIALLKYRQEDDLNYLDGKIADLEKENEKYITCDKCGARILKEKAIKGGDVIREKIHCEPEKDLSNEKYIHTPYWCIHCKKK